MAGIFSYALAGAAAGVGKGLVQQATDAKEERQAEIKFARDQLMAKEGRDFQADENKAQRTFTTGEREAGQVFSDAQATNRDAAASGRVSQAAELSRLLQEQGDKTRAEETDKTRTYNRGLLGDQRDLDAKNKKDDNDRQDLLLAQQQKRDDDLLKGGTQITMPDGNIAVIYGGKVTMVTDPAGKPVEAKQEKNMVVWRSVYEKSRESSLMQGIPDAEANRIAIEEANKASGGAAPAPRATPSAAETSRPTTPDELAALPRFGSRAEADAAPPGTYYMTPAGTLGRTPL
jgi:hypothetical protein